MVVLDFLKKTLKWIVVAFFASTILSVIIYRFVPVFVTPLMVIRVIEQIGDGKEIKMKHSWTSIDHMSKYMPVAVIASEDANFLEHHGFDFEAIEKAILRSESWEHRPYRSRQQRTCSCGLDVHGFAKVLKLISPCLLNCCGANSASWRYI